MRVEFCSLYFKKLLSLCEICVKSLGWLLVYRYHTVRFIYDCAEVTIVEFHVTDTYTTYISS